MRSNIRRDRSIFELVDEVQSYSNPQDAIPSPPVDKRPDPRSFVREPPPGRDGPDRHRPPDWFKPKDTEPAAIDDLGTDLPAVPEDTEVEIPAGNEDQEVATTGVEALAYYAPFHFYARRWGIYIRDFGLADLACKFLGRRKLTSADNWVLECAYHFLLQHEYFHFQTEVGVSRYEILLFQGGKHSRQAIVITTAGKARQGLKQGHSEIIRSLHDNLTIWRGRERIRSDQSILELYRNAEYSRVPITGIHDARLVGFGSARQFPKAFGLQVTVYSNDHPPPHIHIHFSDGAIGVKVDWPSLQPSRNERSLTRTERRDLEGYLNLHQPKILDRVRAVFADPNLPPALANVA